MDFNQSLLIKSCVAADDRRVDGAICRQMGQGDDPFNLEAFNLTISNLSLIKKDKNGVITRVVTTGHCVNHG